MKKKIKKLIAHLKKFKGSTPHLMDVTMAELKEAFGELHKIEEAEAAEKNPGPNFSSWPPEMPERHHKWRQSDEIQKARLDVPEPLQTEGDDWLIPAGTCDCRRLKKKMFATEDGSRFVAWTADGKTPVFPIPL